MVNRNVSLFSLCTLLFVSSINSWELDPAKIETLLEQIKLSKSSAGSDNPGNKTDNVKDLSEKELLLEKCKNPSLFLVGNRIKMVKSIKTRATECKNQFADILKSLSLKMINIKKDHIKQLDDLARMAKMTFDSLLELNLNSILNLMNWINREADDAFSNDQCFDCSSLASSVKKICVSRSYGFFNAISNPNGMAKLVTTFYYEASMDFMTFLYQNYVEAAFTGTLNIDKSVADEIFTRMTLFHKASKYYKQSNEEDTTTPPFEELFKHITGGKSKMLVNSHNRLADIKETMRFYRDKYDIVVENVDDRGQEPQKQTYFFRKDTSVNGLLGHSSQSQPRGQLMLRI